MYYVMFIWLILLNNSGELSAVKQAFGDNLAEELIKTYDGSNLVSDSQQDLIGEKYLAEQIKIIQEQQRTSSILDKWSHLLYQGEQEDKQEEEVSNAEQEETEVEHEEMNDQTQEQQDQSNEHENEEFVEQERVQEVEEEEGQAPSVYLNNTQPNETIDSQYSYLVKESQQQPTQLRLSHSGGNLVQSSNESQRDTEGEQNDEEEEEEEEEQEEQEQEEQEQEEQEQEEREQDQEQEEQDHEQEEHETEVEEQEIEQDQILVQRSTLDDSNYVTEVNNDNEKINSQVHSQSQMGGSLEPRSLSDFKLKSKQNEFRGTESRIRTDARGGAGASQSDYQHSRSNHQQHGWSGQNSHTYMPQFSSSNLNSVTIDAYNSPQFKAMLEQLTKPLNVPPEHVNFPPEWPSQDKISKS
jgi:hypothetical protein